MKNPSDASTRRRKLTRSPCDVDEDGSFRKKRHLSSSNHSSSSFRKRDVDGQDVGKFEELETESERK